MWEDEHGRRRRGRPEQRWIDCVKSDMRAIGAAEEDVHDRTGWKSIVERHHNSVGTARRRRRRFSKLASICRL